MPLNRNPTHRIPLNRILLSRMPLNILPQNRFLKFFFAIYRNIGVNPQSFSCNYNEKCFMKYGSVTHFPKKMLGNPKIPRKVQNKVI